MYGDILHVCIVDHLVSNFVNSVMACTTFRFKTKAGCSTRLQHVQSWNRHQLAYNTDLFHTASYLGGQSDSQSISQHDEILSNWVRQSREVLHPHGVQHVHRVLHPHRVWDAHWVWAPTGSETPMGSETPPTGSATLTEYALPTGSETPPTGSEPPPKGSETPPTGSETPPTGSETPPRGSETPTGSKTPMGPRRPRGHVRPRGPRRPRDPRRPRGPRHPWVRDAHGVWDMTLNYHSWNSFNTQVYPLANFLPEKATCRTASASWCRLKTQLFWLLCLNLIFK